MKTVFGHLKAKINILIVHFSMKHEKQTTMDISSWHTYVIANAPAERRRSAGEMAENSATGRMLYAEKFSIKLP